MKTVNKYILLGLLQVSAAFTLGSCTDVDVDPDGRLAFDEIFTNEKLIAGWLQNCYSTFTSQLVGTVHGNSTFLDCATDNAWSVDDVEGGALYQWNTGMATKQKNPLVQLDRWEALYTGIRRCNIFINRVSDPKYGDNIHTLGYRDRWIAEAKTLRAYYYLQLIKVYGGVPLILDQSDDSDYDYTRVRPATFGQVARQIVTDCHDALNCDELSWQSGNAGSDFHRASKGMAAAVMSEAALFAASPLNADGSFSWAEAAELTKEALDGCLAHGYKLYTTAPAAWPATESMVSVCAYDKMFLTPPDAMGTADPECIIAGNQINVWQMNAALLLNGQQRAGACPSQELVDCYETTDGIRPILGYKDADHLQPIINPEAILYDESNPYANRDPRLKATIYYNGEPAHLVDQAPDPLILTGEGQRFAISATSLRYTRTGYYLHKYFNLTSSLNANIDGHFRICRLAELYLNYAEAACEAATDAVPQAAVQAVNAVRQRVQMPALPYSISRDEMRERVRNERRVEFAFEDVRFYDVRRWQTLDQCKVVTGIRPTDSVDADGNYRADHYTRFVVGRRYDTDAKHLRLPVPSAEAMRLKNITGLDFQNPGW